jgi:glycosyltransferase A (GT-A) superfamily protein (DUF2064 family)
VPAAAALAEAMLVDSAAAVARAAPPDARLVVYHDPPDAAPRLAALGLDRRFAFVPQPAETLGGRLGHLVERELRGGATACVIAATDSPFAVEGIVELVPREADEVVLAPCEDGGYWGVGLARPAPIFDVPMSTRDVLAATVARARAAGRPVRLLAPALDIDLVADLTAAAARGLLQRAPRTREAWVEAAAAPT